MVNWPQARFMDGSPVPDSYLEALQPLLDGAAEAEERFSLDELEEFSRRRNNDFRSKQN